MLRLFPQACSAPLYLLPAYQLPPGIMTLRCLLPQQKRLSRHFLFPGLFGRLADSYGSHMITIGVIELFSVMRCISAHLYFPSAIHLTTSLQPHDYAVPDINVGVIRYFYGSLMDFFCINSSPASAATDSGDLIITTNRKIEPSIF